MNITMSLTSGIVVDGLWRALCPSIDAILCSSYQSASRSRPRPQSSSRPLAASRNSRRNDGFPTTRPRCQARHMHGSAALANGELLAKTPLDSSTKNLTIEPKNNKPPSIPQLSTIAVFHLLFLAGPEDRVELHIWQSSIIVV